MGSSGVTQRLGTGADRSFFMIMSVVIALIIVSGFGPRYASKLSPPGLPIWVHLHGAVMTAWIALFVAQCWLVGRRAYSLHKRLGWLSIGLVVIMAPLGVITNAMAIQRGAVAPFFTPATLLALDDLDLSLFLGLYAGAIVLRRNGDWHKRLMLCATVLLTFPAIGRSIPIHNLGLSMIIPASTAVLIGLALIGPVFDLATRRRVHPAYFWGVGLIIAAQPLHGWIAASPLVQSLAHRLAS
jgi:uncharacterized membrane protein YozB (DUF420 family)